MAFAQASSRPETKTPFEDTTTGIIPFAADGPDRLVACMPRHSAEIALKRNRPGQKQPVTPLFIGTLVSRATGRTVKRVACTTIVCCRLALEDAYVKVLAADRAHPPRITRTFTDFVDAEQDTVERRLKGRADVYRKRFGLRLLSLSFKRERVDGRPALSLQLFAEEIVQ